MTHARTGPLTLDLLLLTAGRAGHREPPANGLSCNQIFLVEECNGDWRSAG